MNKILKFQSVSLLTLFGFAAGCSTAARPIDGTKSAWLHDDQQNQKAVKPAPLNQSVEESADYHFSLAQAYANDGDPTRAIEEYRLALVYDPKSAIIHARLANEYIKKNEFTAAIESVQESVRIDPKFIDARLIFAGLLANAKDNDEALAEYARILKIDPKHEEAMVYRAQLLIEGEKASVASQELRDFVRRSPEAVLAWYYLGKSEQRLSRLDSAIVAMKRAVEIRPTFHQAQLSLGYLHESKGDTKTAIALYQKVFDQSQDQNAANRLATLLLKEEKFAEAVRYLEAIEAADPEDMNSRVKLGLILMELKRYPDAIKRFEEILAKYPDSERINYYLGNLYQETGELDRAIAQLQKIDEKSKLFSDASLHIASLYRISKKFEQAKAAIHRGIRVSPRTSGFYLLGANISDELGEPAEAINLLERGVAMLPEDEKLHYYLGSLYDKQGRVDEGLVQIEAILKINPNNVDALNYVGYTWAVRGVRLNEAEKLLKKAVALKPDNAYIRDSWGYLLLVRGRLRESIIEFELAARLKPNEPVILEHLADAYLKSNLREKAFATYSEALKYATDETLRSQLDQKIQGLKVQLARESADQRNPASASSGPSAKLPE